MNGGLLIWLFIVHLLSDFVIQSQNLLDERFSTEAKILVRGNLKHAAIHLILSIMVLAYYLFSPWVLLPVGLIFISHLAIDIGKSYIIKIHPSNKYSVFLFLADQFIHGIILFIIAYFVSKQLHVPGFITLIVNMENDFISSFLFAPNQKILLGIMLMIIGLWGVGVFINLFVGRMKIGHKKAPNVQIVFSNSQDGDNSVPKGGFLIGVLERLIIILAVAFNMISVIGFLITVKSIARFKKFDDDKFVEYFIIGSFISIVCAIVIGIIIRQLNILPLVK